MKRIVEVIKKLRNTGSSKEKLRILEENKDGKNIPEILYYTYNPFLKYGVTEKVFKESVSATAKDINDLFNLVEKLSNENINDSLRAEANMLACGFDSEEKEIAIGVMCKDLKIGLTAKSINKVFGGLIPEFNVQLATPLDKVNLVEDTEIWVTEKFDGVRCVCIVKETDIKFYSRNGKEILGLNDLESDIRTFIDKNHITEDVVLDGELLKINKENKNSGDLYRDTVSVVNSKIKDKKDIVFNIFDVLPYNDFLKGESGNRYWTRRLFLDSSAGIANKYCKYVKIAEILYHGKDHSVIPKLLEEIETQGKEGLMINTDDIYRCKRSKSLIKVKSFYTLDLRVIDVVEGTGRNKGKLGAVIVEYKGNLVEVGSGFTDVERETFFNDKQKIMGKIIEIQYFEESKNKKGDISLRFPTFKGVRFDKDIEDK